MKGKKVIGFVAMHNHDPFHNRAAWSGSIYKLREAIEMAGFEVRWIPYNTRTKSKLLYHSINIWNRCFRKHQWLPSHHFRPSVKAWAKEIDANPKLKECDYLFYPLTARLPILQRMANHTSTSPTILLQTCWTIISIT